MSASSLTRFNRLTLRRRFVTRLWKMLPALSLLVLMLPAAFPNHASSISEVWPPLALPAMFYWGLMRPDRLRLPLVFGLGLVQDALMSTPFGSTAILWALFRYLSVLRRNHIADEGFVGHWVAYSALLVFILGLQWAIVGVYVGQPMPVAPALIQCVIGVLCYPAMHAVLYTIEHFFYRKYWYILQPA